MYLAISAVLFWHPGDLCVWTPKQQPLATFLLYQILSQLQPSALQHFRLSISMNCIATADKGSYNGMVLKAFQQASSWWQTLPLNNTWYALVHFSQLLNYDLFCCLAKTCNTHVYGPFQSLATSVRSKGLNDQLGFESCLHGRNIEWSGKSPTTVEWLWTFMKE